MSPSPSPFPSPPQTVFLGAGNMAEALVSGILASGLRDPAQVTMTDLRPERLEEMRNRFGVRVLEDNAAAVRDAGEIFLCVKPQQMDGVLAPLRDAAPGALWISIAAGVPCARIENALGGSPRVVRVMPNTPALVRAGAAGVAGGTHASPEDLDTTRVLLECVGVCVEVEEHELHAVTALSGSGPAYAFLLVESMLRGAEELGLDPAKAKTLAVQTLLGSARLLEESGASPAVLRERVTSKGGTTAAALATFDRAGVPEGIVQGVLDAAARSRELAGEGG